MFERLFGDGSNAQERIARKQAKASLLDAVTHEVARLNNTLPGTDRSRLNEFLEDIREIERRLKNVAKSNDSSPDAAVPFGMPESFDEHIKLMWDLQLLAFQGDITRVSTLMYAHDVSMRAYPESGVTTANHASSHHGGIPKRVEDWAKINRFHVQCLPYFLAKLKAAPDGDGNLLDHTLIFWASNMGDSNLHSHKAVPNMLIGGAIGRHKGGRHVHATGPTSNLLLMAPYSNMPEDVKKIAMDTEAAISGGSLHPFKCPVVDQEGKSVECKGGTHLDDGQILGMNFYVKGIDDKFPGK